MKRHAFASDIHLSPGENPHSQQFIAFLDSLHGEIDALHILGDLFHYWLGPGHEALPDYQAVIEAFRRLSESGVVLNFISGNRDFLVKGRAFKQAAGMNLCGDEHQFSLGQRRIKLVHGDLLCAGDIAYQRFRRVIRSAPVLLLGDLLPLRAKRWIADQLRRMSAREVQRKSMKTMDLDEQVVLDLFRDGTDMVVCGHIHKEQHRRYELGGRSCDLFVLGAWEGEAPYLRLDEDGEPSFARGL